MDGGLPIREFRPSKEPARDPNSPLRAAAAAAAAEEAERARDAAAQREVVADASQAASGVARATALRALAASGRVSAADAVGLYGTSRRGFFCTAGDAAARHQALEAARAVVARGDAGDAGAVLDMAAAALGPEAGEGDADARLAAALCFRDGLLSTSAGVRAAAVERLPGVVPAVEDGDARVQAAVLRLLGEELGDLREKPRGGPGGRVARAAAIAAARVAGNVPPDGDPGRAHAPPARAAACAFVETTCCWTAECQAAVLAAAASGDAPLRLAAVSALATAPYKERIAAAVANAESDGDARVRDAASYAKASLDIAGEAKARRRKAKDAGGDATPGD